MLCYENMSARQAITSVKVRTVKFIAMEMLYTVGCQYCPHSHYHPSLQEKREKGKT